MSVPAMFNHTLQQTADWLKSLGGEETINTEKRAYAALRAVLHQLRDRLTVEEATDLGAQLPLLVRGIYYENWNPAKTPEKVRRDEFILGVEEKLDGHPEIDAEEAIRATFRVLSEKVTPGEIEEVIGMLPKDMRDLWPSQSSGSA
ncbi:hypothetical protein CAI21_17880 [Alkalilimnicola ehrlichii]|uniref:DUF2267 domain-containing protein n=1 Tax=Alkalilimnicola ehrlichii TaxID=351052 RepID=A0A3E0WM07_9GAMM|nr:DUF2267 domain-containing protein [Alkalilimnicola ehrlichii]RFA25830.1 hypothetical protein CAI21_17880 [Alkalilimnicola ehrlichii]RFA33117.1 hypothetical protein CAL65_18305 [Alkalilimnicola ehrlichii]